MKKTDDKAKGRDMTKTTKSAVILRWNPVFSSFGTESLVYSLGEMTSHPRGQMDWSAFDYKRVHKGDECYLLKVGGGSGRNLSLSRSMLSASRRSPAVSATG